MKRNGNRLLRRDLIHEKVRGDLTYIISEDYSYKTEAYYRILTLEMEGRKTVPSTRDLLEAYVVPVCLTRAKGAGIPVCEWGISDERVPIPSILYGISYFADPSEYSLVRDIETADPVIKYITGNGKYPFCYQPVPETADIVSCVAIFGVVRVIGSPQLIVTFIRAVPALLLTFAFVASASHSIFLRRFDWAETVFRSLFLISPREHLLHHAAKIQGNYGNFTAVWDHAFGTYIAPAAREFPLGLDYDQDFLGAITAGCFRLSPGTRSRFQIARVCYLEESVRPQQE